MTFKDVLDAMTIEAAKLALPLHFGGDELINVKANDIAGDFLTFDVSGANTPAGLSSISTYRVTVQSLGESYYMRDDAQELQTLTRTDIAIRKLLITFACKFDLQGINTDKVQNIYDTPKSGWRATFNVTDNIAG